MFPALVRCGPTPVKSEHAVASILGPACTRPGLESATLAIASSSPAGIFVLSAALGLGSQALFAGPRMIDKRSIVRALGYLALMLFTTLVSGVSQSFSAMSVQLSATNTMRSGVAELSVHGETTGVAQKGLSGLAHSST